MYWEAITVLEAQDCLVQLEIMDFPNMKQNKRQQIYKKYKKYAYPRLDNDKSPELKLNELAKILSRKS